jgi:hypothetical protein
MLLHGYGTAERDYHFRRAKDVFSQAPALHVLRSGFSTSTTCKLSCTGTQVAFSYIPMGSCVDELQRCNLLNFA